MRRILIDCKEHIPCNPCQFACPTHAIVVGEDITELPHADSEKCVGCGACVAACPGQACFLIDPDFSESEATIDFPYEYLPLPPVGLEVEARNNLGETLCTGRVVKVLSLTAYDHTNLVRMAVPKDLVQQVRGMKPWRG
ncbi:4Fe-4S dicluster domain-containing protein [Pseudoflavonifractor sp. DSM 107456]|uniref:4Fe-4S dicluster domain-containing protein n=1 Tax=Pseudoflavonifractor gallinarum TaxID=2779352 RepID=A0ABR9R8G4_9FIRM|nr:4Fe-4S dicluster domain-containing protein [Pseudoflavonifractor gallinarum]MBE5054993.1 4Fe-4S dicluster domain-containing protein [Pseudoflavonifractor gallinarum]